MAKVQVQIGSAARKELFFALDSASTTGAGKTGVSGTMAAYYVRNDTTPTATSIASPAFTEVSSVNMPGVYYLTVPIGAFATGASTCVVMITGTGMAPVTMEYQLVGYDPTDGVRLGLTSLPNAACSNNASLITSGTGTAQLSVASGLVTLAAVTHTGATIPTVTTVSNRVSANTDQWNGVAVTGMPMPTYTQPTGFLAASFPTSVASPTNITAGTITTVSGNVSGNVTGSVGSIAANGIASTSFASGAITSTAIANSAITIRLSSDGTTSNARLQVGAVAGDVWTAVVSTYDPSSANTTAIFAKAILKSDAQAKNGDVTMYSIAGTNGIDVDLHRIANDQTAATNLKNALNGTGGVTISATLDALSTTERNAVSDALLNRNVAGGSSTGRLVKEALYALRNKTSISGSTLQVWNNDDTSIVWSATLSSDAAAIPITGIDPA